MTLALLLSAALAAQSPASPAHSGAGAAATAVTATQQEDDQRIFEITVSFLFADVELGPGDSKLRVFQSRDAAEPDRPPTLHFASEEDYRVDDGRWYLRLGESHSISGRKEDPMVDFAMALSSPRIRMREGGDAEVFVGEEVPFLVRRDDGAFDLRRNQEMAEGLAVSVVAPTLEDGIVDFEAIRMRISEVIGREEVEGLPFDAGRPILKSSEVKIAGAIPLDKIGFIRVPGFVHDDGLLYLAVNVELVAGDD